MYIVDFFKRIARKSNIPVIIYLVLNILVIAALINCISGGEANFFLCLLISLVVYAISLTIALSPIGEWILRLQTGCKKIKRREQKEYIMPIFNEVYERARAFDPSIPTDVQVFISEDSSPNAFATGRKTVCVTEGMLQKPVDQIKAALGHEFGHLAHKDTDLILVVTIGNFFVTAIVTFIKLIIIAVRIGVSMASDSFGTIFADLFSLIFVDFTMWVWTKIGTWLVMKSSRSNEFEADEFSFRLGYGDSLCQLLDSFGKSGRKGLFATLESTHPEKDDRIARIQDLGAAYRSAEGAGLYGNQISSMQQQADVQSYNAQPAAALGFGGGMTAIPQPQMSAPVQPQMPQPPVSAPQMSAPQMQQPPVSAPMYSQPMYTQAQPQMPQTPVSAPQMQSQMPQQVQTPMPLGNMTVNQAPAHMMAPTMQGRTCSSCGSMIEEDSKFCQECGTPVPALEAAPAQTKRFCTGCGTPIEGSAAFCSNCGTRLS